MAEEKTEKVFVNTLMDADLVEKLDEMAKDNESSRAGVIRLLVKKGYEEFSHFKVIKQRTTTKIKQVARS